MHKIFYLFISTNLILVNISAQNSLAEKIKYSDSILIVSYKAPSPIRFNNKEEPDQIINNGKLNDIVIKERRSLNASQKKQLKKILSLPFRDSLIDRAMCFLPRHSILIFAKGKISYIHLCFQCKEIETSSDIKIPNNDFDQATWKKLMLFLKNNGLKYGYNENL